jgi:GT2 family glycosyltransferase
MTPPAHISIIIPTYTRARLLSECLQQLSGQSFEAADEVIVVDNGSADDTGEIVKSYEARFPVPLRLLCEPVPGKSHALACGVAVAKGDVLAFLDDDVVVDRHWLEIVRDTMRKPDVALMGGRVMPLWEDTVPEWMRVAPAHHARLGAPLGLLDYPDDVHRLGPRTVLGGNMAIRREVIARVGGFASHLGKLRGTLLSGEDHELCMRVQRAGFLAVYVPHAVVHHWVPAERTRVSYFVNWFYWSGITNAMLDADPANHVGGRSLFGLPLFLAKRAVVAMFAAARAFLGGRRETALHHATDVAFAAGYAAQRWGLRT